MKKETRLIQFSRKSSCLPAVQKKVIRLNSGRPKRNPEQQRGSRPYTGLECELISLERFAAEKKEKKLKNSINDFFSEGGELFRRRYSDFFGVFNNYNYFLKSEHINLQLSVERINSALTSLRKVQPLNKIGNELRDRYSGMCFMIARYYESLLEMRRDMQKGVEKILKRYSIREGELHRLAARYYEKGAEKQHDNIMGPVAFLWAAERVGGEPEEPSFDELLEQKIYARKASNRINELAKKETSFMSGLEYSVLRNMQHILHNKYNLG